MSVEALTGVEQHVNTTYGESASGGGRRRQEAPPGIDSGGTEPEVVDGARTVERRSNDPIRRRCGSLFFSRVWRTAAQRHSGGRRRRGRVGGNALRGPSKRSDAGKQWTTRRGATATACDYCGGWASASGSRVRHSTVGVGARTAKGDDADKSTVGARRNEDERFSIAVRFARPRRYLPFRRQTVRHRATRILGH